MAHAFEDQAAVSFLSGVVEACAGDVLSCFFCRAGPRLAGAVRGKMEQIRYYVRIPRYAFEGRERLYAISHFLSFRIWEGESAGDKRVPNRERTMSKPLGVGIIGAGPVTQAIHLPTVATLGDRLQVVHIMDVNAEVGALVASRTGARSTTSVQTLLEDPEVDVVAICSPPSSSSLSDIN